MADETKPPAPETSPAFSMPKFGFAGFCLLVGLVTFAIQQGCAVTGTAPSWIWGTVWFSLALILVILAIWFWDQTATHHWARKSVLTAVTVLIMGGLSYIPIAKQYRAELTPQNGQTIPKSPTAAEIAEEIAKKIPREHDVEKEKKDKVGITDKVSVKVHRAAPATELEEQAPHFPNKKKQFAEKDNRDSSKPQVQPPPLTTAAEAMGLQFACDSGMLQIVVKPAETDTFLLFGLTPFGADTTAFQNTGPGPYLWPESSGDLSHDWTWKCTITNIGAKKLYNTQPNITVTFASNMSTPPSIVKKTLWALYIPFLDPGQSYTFYGVNMSNFNVNLELPDTVMTKVVGSTPAWKIPMIRRDRDPVDQYVPFWIPTKNKWAGLKIVGIVPKPDEVK